MVTFSVEADPLLPRILAAGESLRRIQRSENLAADGRRSIWHQGTELTELLSWEDRDLAIDHQELTFLNLVVDYRKGRGLRTGIVPDAERENGRPTTDMIEFDPTPSERILLLAAQLLRQAKRDYYTQHLLSNINDLLDSRFSQAQTQVYELGRWKDRLRRASAKVRELPKHRLRLALYVATGLVVGATIAALVLFS